MGGPWRSTASSMSGTSTTRKMRTALLPSTPSSTSGSSPPPSAPSCLLLSRAPSMRPRDPTLREEVFGYDAESKEYDAEEHKERIFGGHVRDYMESMEQDDPDKYAAHFKRFIDADIGPDDLEDLYGKVHAAIRADPAPKITDKKKPELTADVLALKKDVVYTDDDGNLKYVCRNKRTRAQRKNRVE